MSQNNKGVDAPGEKDTRGKTQKISDADKQRNSGSQMS